ncbi:hypothetical protein BVC80_1823g46 [Macleaya cordata]|uniref:Uncharacterized protein n=1 Tax=Macleaya cordata TaxID=56857 RepID=A0A200QZX7_MACCD|nr:hypothetical protein BVC80_1823g46 [Macleaya cordata]
MGARWKWVGVVRRKLAKSQPQNTIIVVHINNSRSLREDEEEEHEKHDQKSSCERTVESKEVAGGNWEKVDDDDVDAASLARKNKLAQEQVAAIKIQSFFRGKTGISSTKEPGEGAGIVSWGAREEAATLGPALHGCTYPAATQGSFQAAHESIL